MVDLGPLDLVLVLESLLGHLVVLLVVGLLELLPHLLLLDLHLQLLLHLLVVSVSVLSLLLLKHPLELLPLLLGLAHLPVDVQLHLLSLRLHCHARSGRPIDEHHDSQFPLELLLLPFGLLLVHHLFVVLEGADLLLLERLLEEDLAMADGLVVTHDVLLPLPLLLPLPQHSLVLLLDHLIEESDSQLVILLLRLLLMALLVLGIAQLLLPQVLLRLGTVTHLMLVLRLVLLLLLELLGEFHLVVDLLLLIPHLLVLLLLQLLLQGVLDDHLLVVTRFPLLPHLLLVYLPLVSSYLDPLVLR